MKAAWYERQGAAAHVLIVGDIDDPQPGPGDVRIRVAASGVNPGDVKKRNNAFGYGMAYARVIPHSDGAGTVDRVGAGVDDAWVGKRVWCYGAQSYRPFGTAAEFTVVPLQQMASLADGVSFDVGACLGIPGITAHYAVHAAGNPAGRTVLVHGAAGAVGACAVVLARRAGARVIATVRSAADASSARDAGAHIVLPVGSALAEEIDSAAPTGVDHIIDVAFGANLALNARVLAQGGTIAAYASVDPNPALPFWPLLFQNARIVLIGSDDLPTDAKRAAASDLNDALASGWSGPPIAQRFSLADIALAHNAVEYGNVRGRVVVRVAPH